MTILTSISPTHILGPIQNQAMKSWADNGFKVYSLNAQSEIDTLKSQYPFITFIPDIRCHENEKMHGKPYISIASFFDFAQTLQDPHIIITNSDIELKKNHAIIDKIKKILDRKGFIIAKRYNYTNSFTDGRREGAGVDLFGMHKDILPRLPRTYEFVMGQCWWDYWLPTVIMNLKIPLYRIEYPFIYHKRHSLQWSQKLWHDLSRLFIKDTGYRLGGRTPEQISSQIHNSFYNRAMAVTLATRV
jgi:hypothetical protein